MTRENLDTWARSLGARNDAEAVAALRSLRTVVYRAHSNLEFARLMAGQDVLSETALELFLLEAFSAVENALDTITAVSRQFHAHERGRS